MSKVTYLLGAGASFNSLPIVEKIPAAINDIIINLRKYSITQTHLQEYRDLDTFLHATLNDLEFLYQGCITHQSIDTFAKKYFLQNNIAEYNRIKSIIILFFDLHYFFTKQYDKRYDSFIASVMNPSKPKFSKEIDIISWNYDYEFEKTYSNYLPKDEPIEAAYKDIHVVHKNNSEVIFNPEEKLKIIKINGTSGYYISENNNPAKLELGLGCNCLLHDNDFNNPKSIFQLLIKHNKYPLFTNVNCSLSFAWEQDKGNIQINEEIKKSITRTETIVIIGYSFPYFNRNIDRIIFDRQNCVYLTKIYVQDPNPQDIIESIKGFNDNWHGITFVPIKNLNQFYMPHELD